MSKFKASSLIKKKVIDSNARDVGTIADISFDDSDWNITSIHLKIPGQICVELQLSKFKLGSKIVLMSTELIKQIGDNVQLTTPINEVVSQSEVL